METVSEKTCFEEVDAILKTRTKEIVAWILSFNEIQPHLNGGGILFNSQLIKDTLDEVLTGLPIPAGSLHISLVTLSCIARSMSELLEINEVPAPKMQRMEKH